MRVEKRFWLNTGVGLALTALMGVLLAGGPGYPGWFFSPYFLLVIWISVTHGWIEGLITSLAAGLLGVHGHQLVWLLAAALYTGALADGNRRRIRQLRGRVLDQAERLVRLNEQHTVLRRALEELQSRVSDRQNGLATLYDVYRRVTLLRPEELPAAVVDVVADVIEADQCSFYRLDGGRLYLEVQRGWSAVPDEARVVPLGDDLLSQAAVQKQLQSLPDFPLERLRGENTSLLRLLAAPVLHPRTGRCLGVISVEGLPFSSFTRTSARLLETVAELAALTLAGSAADDTSDWLSAEHFRRHLRQELLAVQKGEREPFHLIQLQLGGLPDLPAEVGRRAERGLELLLQAHFRPHEKRGRGAGSSVTVQLATADKGTAEHILSDLSADVERFLSAWVVELAGSRWEAGLTSSVGADTPEAALLQARAGARPLTLASPAPNLYLEKDFESLQNLLRQPPVPIEVRHAFIHHCLKNGAEGASEQVSLLKMI